MISNFAFSNEFVEVDNNSERGTARIGDNAASNSVTASLNVESVSIGSILRFDSWRNSAQGESWEKENKFHSFALYAFERFESDHDGRAETN